MKIGYFSIPNYSIPILHGILRKMARGRKLTEYEKGLIDAYHQAGKSNREIARLLRRSLDVVNRYRRNPAVYGTRKPTGRPKTISDRDKSRIMRKASNSVKTCSAIKKELGLNVTAEWVRRVILTNPNIRQRRLTLAWLVVLFAYFKSLSSQKFKKLGVL